MSPAAVLTGVAVVCAFAAVWELVGSRGEEEAAAAARRALGALSGGRARSLAEAALRLGIPRRLARAGLTDRVPVPAVLVAKLAAALAGAGLAVLAVPAAPGRLALIVAGALPVAGFLAPDALLEREARRRRARLALALPDALDLLAVGADAGRWPGAVLGEIAEGTTGPLARELAVASAEIECGASQRAALTALRDRIPGREIAALASALDRSSRYGSPLADRLREQATALRRDHRRRIEEQAARAAPKIQLVVALVLVPSVLLMIAAALLAKRRHTALGAVEGRSLQGELHRAPPPWASPVRFPSRRNRV